MTYWIRPCDGAKPSARAYDAMIAATAMTQNLPVYTCNPADFAAIGGLTVIAVPVPPAGQDGGRAQENPST
jgi:tRNA(fMet)-specific endonuclease VapC